MHVDGNLECSRLLTVTSGSPGTGSAPVTYTAAPNLLTTDRTGTITIAGQTFTVVSSRTRRLASAYYENAWTTAR